MQKFLPQIAEDNSLWVVFNQKPYLTSKLESRKAMRYRCKSHWGHVNSLSANPIKSLKFVGWSANFRHRLHSITVDKNRKEENSWPLSWNDLQFFSAVSGVILAMFKGCFCNKKAWLCRIILLITHQLSKLPSWLEDCVTTTSSFS